ncbi:hypothetical protein ACHAXR_012643 [Thalassiosira sp. AJA248-18]
MTSSSLSHHHNEEEETNPLLLSSTTAISTSPYAHRDTILRSTFLTQKHNENTLLDKQCQEISRHNILLLFIWDTYSAITVFATMLISLESIVGCLLTVGATLLAYYSTLPSISNDGVDALYNWNGQLPTVLLSFAVITPLSQSISMAFQRREAALKALAMYRSSVYNVYVAHSSWDWSVCSKGKGRRGCVENEEDEVAVYGSGGEASASAAAAAASSRTPNNNSNEKTKQQKHIDWINHSDITLNHLIHLSDSLYQYLTLPTATRARHRATSKGRLEANQVLSTGRDIFTVNVYGRMIMLSQLTEALKYRGLPGNEASRIRQWENSMTTSMENLRIVKEYRTLQALRVFGRLFSLLLPPFYATSYVQVAMDADSLALGIALGVMTSIALTGLFECVRRLEDPFVSHTTLDGIDVREELVVLAHQELMVARRMLFPEAKKFVLKQDIFEADVKGGTPGSGNKEKEEEKLGLDRKSRHFHERG